METDDTAADERREKIDSLIRDILRGTVRAGALARRCAELGVDPDAMIGRAQKIASAELTAVLERPS